MAEQNVKPTLDIESGVEGVPTGQANGKIKTGGINIQPWLQSIRARELLRRINPMRTLANSLQIQIQLAIALNLSIDKTEHTLASIYKNLTEIQKCERKSYTSGNDVLYIHMEP